MGERTRHLLASAFAPLLLAACGSAGDGADPAAPEQGREAAGRDAQETSALTVSFTDVTASSGLDFRHRSGAAGEFLFPEIMGAGGALLDYDRDGDLDVYLVQSGVLKPDPARPPALDQLFRNELVPSGELKFVDVTRAAGLTATGYGMGAAVGDVDGDGWPDLYVTHAGRNTLWRNTGEGGFVDVTSRAGGADEGWGTSAAFFDFDADGDDDLFVANYVHYGVDGNVRCRTQAGAPDYCAPATYEPAPDRLFRNDDGRLVDVTREAGMDRAYGNGLGMAVADFNGDGRPDVYVANDQTPNVLWINAGDGQFVDEALMAGAAYNGSGAVEASMGVTAGDADGDGDEDLFMTHLNGESNTLYVNDGNGNFTDASAAAGLAAGSMPYTGFGARFFDANNDGVLDLFVANGGVTIDVSRAASGENPFAQHDQLFLGTGNGRFDDASAALRAVAAAPRVGRGALFGDLDNDGDTDVVVTNNDGPAVLLRNDSSSGRPWLGVRLLDRHGRVSVGRVALLDNGTASQWRRAGRDGSYLSSSDPRVLLAPPAAATQVSVGVTWPDGTIERFDALNVRGWHDLARGQGSAAEF